MMALRTNGLLPPRVPDAVTPKFRVDGSSRDLVGALPRHSILQICRIRSRDGRLKGKDTIRMRELLDICVLTSSRSRRWQGSRRTLPQLRRCAMVVLKVQRVGILAGRDPARPELTS